MKPKFSISIKYMLIAITLLLLSVGSQILASNEDRPTNGDMVLSLKAGIPPKEALGTLNNILSSEDMITRGASEIRIFKRWSPAVVLVEGVNGFGSGALINRTGHVITNWHVVEGSPVVRVFFKPTEDNEGLAGTTFTSADVKRIDKIKDLALLSLRKVPTGIEPIVFGTPDQFEVGADVHAIGHPVLETWTYTRGFISQIRNDYGWTYEDSEHVADVIQIQTPIGPGSSGGPLLNAQGKLLGVISFSSQELDSIHYAVSVEEVETLLASPIDGDVSREEFVPTALDQLCGNEAIQEFRDAKKSAYIQLFDQDCDGKADSRLSIPEDETHAITLLIEGVTRTVFYDTNRDGNPDFALYDIDGDKKADMVGYFREGEQEPYEYKKWHELTYLS